MRQRYFGGVELLRWDSALNVQSPPSVLVFVAIVPWPHQLLVSNRNDLSAVWNPSTVRSPHDIQCLWSTRLSKNVAHWSRRCSWNRVFVQQSRFCDAVGRMYLSNKCVFRLLFSVFLVLIRCVKYMKWPTKAVHCTDLPIWITSHHLYVTAHNYAPNNSFWLQLFYTNRCIISFFNRTF